MKKMKIVYILLLFILIAVLGQNLNPFGQRMFTFHDETQPARIQQFTLNLKNLKIPPRIAPDFSFHMGYPVFNFYAPTAYWITSFIHLSGLDIVSALKLSFLLALVIALLGSFLFFRIFFDFYPSFLGSTFYITSLYFPLTIFVRGNLAELWFLALFPLAFYLVIKNSVKHDKKIFLTTSFILFLTATSHNIYSLLFVPIIIIFMVLLKNKKRNFLSLMLALLLSAYFWLPVLMEMKYTWAKEVATMTLFEDHFLCPYQLWQSPWGFGGSTKGCQNDGMSFKIGKLQIIFFILGIVVFIRKKLRHKTALFFFVLTFFSLFLTTYLSQPIWKMFSFAFSLIQFPWRFIGFSLLGIAFFSAYFLQYFKIPFRVFFIIFFVLLVLFINGKYFKGQSLDKKVDFEKKYLSEDYVAKKAAYSIAEYLPKTVDYSYWRSLEKKDALPKDFLTHASISPFSYEQQTTIEKIGNAITLLGFISLIVILKMKWKI